jgi:predicted GNAT family acetyltransferase
VLAEGAGTSGPVRLHVVSSNPARRLYERLGFVQVGTAGAHLALEWRPKPADERF